MASGCAGYQETALHKLAKQVIGDAGMLYVPGLTARYRDRSDKITNGQTIKIDSVRSEVWLGGIRPDLIVTADGRELLVEVYVTHAAAAKKLAWLSERERPSIEIDLSETVEMDQDLIGPYILNSAKRKWLWHPRQMEIDAALKAKVEEWEERRRQREAAARADAEARERRYQEALRIREEERKAEEAAALAAKRAREAIAAAAAEERRVAYRAAAHEREGLARTAAIFAEAEAAFTNSFWIGERVHNWRGWS